MEVIEKTKRVLEKIPQDKRYLVKDALSRYNATISSCDEGFNPESIPPGGIYG